MNDVLLPTYQKYINDIHTLGILIVEKQDDKRTHTVNFDIVMITILENDNKLIQTEHYWINEQKVVVHKISNSLVKEWLLLGTYRKMFELLYRGEVVFQRNNFVEKLKSELNEFPMYDRKLRIGIEFAKLIDKYIEGKVFFKKDNYLDAYSHVIDSLHHLARVAVIENGYYPEVTVWNQVKQIEPEIYKLYEELITSSESLHKRLELLFLASEYLIHSKSQIWTSHIIDILRKRTDWSFEQISEYDELTGYSCYLSILIEYLIDRGFIEVINKETNNKDVYTCLYRVSR